MLETFVSFRSDMAQYRPMKNIKAGLSKAKPEIQKLTFKVLASSYKGIPREIIAEGGHVIPNASSVIKGRMGELLGAVPNGSEWIKSIPKITTTYVQSGNEKDMYRYSGTFKPNPKVMGTWDLARLTPAKAENVEKDILKWLKNPRIKHAKARIQIQDKGRVRASWWSGYFWSGNMLIGTQDGLAKRMAVRTYGGQAASIKTNHLNPGVRSTVSTYG